MQHLFLRSSMVLATTLLVACGGGSTGGSDSPTTPTTPTTPTATTAVVTLQVNTPAANVMGDIWYRIGSAAITRAQITPQDPYCGTTVNGPFTCTIRVPIGQTLTLVAKDQLASVRIIAVTTVSGQNVDPRGSRSQFVRFGGSCSSPERGVCVLTPTTAQTITAEYAPLGWTKVNFVGLVGFTAIVTAPPVLQTFPDISTDNQAVSATSRSCNTATYPVHCYDIITTSNAIIRLQSEPPLGPTPFGASGPLNFVGFDNGCGASTACIMDGGFVESVTMKWEYYQCPTGPSNPMWNYGPVFGNCVFVRPP